MTINISFYICRATKNLFFLFCHMTMDISFYICRTTKNLSFAILPYDNKHFLLYLPFETETSLFNVAMWQWTWPSIFFVRQKNLSFSILLYDNKQFLLSLLYDKEPFFCYFAIRQWTFASLFTTRHRTFPFLFCHMTMNTSFYIYRTTKYLFFNIAIWQ